MNVLESLCQYEMEKIYDDTYVIKEKGYVKSPVCMYLLIGKEKALLIDSGYGFIDLPEIIRTVTDKEVFCICTHGHHDHTLGSWRFEKTYIHSIDAALYKFNTKKPVLTFITMNTARDSYKKDFDFWSIANKWAGQKRKEPEIIDSIKSFDLGDRVISWHLMPGHTQGSIVIIDEKNHTVFDSDAAPKGVWLHLKESSSLNDYIKSLEEYRNFLIENSITRRYVGHSSELVGIEDINKLLACCKSAYSDPKLGTKFKNPYRHARIVKSDGSTVVCAQ